MITNICVSTISIQYSGKVKYDVTQTYHNNYLIQHSGLICVHIHRHTNDSTKLHKRLVRIQKTNTVVAYVTVSMCLYLYLCVFMSMFLCVYASISLSLYLCVCMCLCVCVCVYVSMCLCVVYMSMCQSPLRFMTKPDKTKR